MKAVAIDCDGDALIYFVEQIGNKACHTNARSCFYRKAFGEQYMSAPKAGPGEALPTVEADVDEKLIELAPVFR